MQGGRGESRTDAWSSVSAGERAEGSRSGLLELGWGRERHPRAMKEVSLEPHSPLLLKKQNKTGIPFRQEVGRGLWSLVAPGSHPISATNLLCDLGQNEAPL